MAEVRFRGGRECEGADVQLGRGVVLHLSRSQHGAWEVWGVEVDGRLYREPRDLTGEPLHEGDFRDWIEQRYEEYEAARRNEANRA